MHDRGYPLGESRSQSDHVSDGEISNTILQSVGFASLEAETWLSRQSYGSASAYESCALRHHGNHGDDRVQYMIAKSRLAIVQQSSS